MSQVPNWLPKLGTFGYVDPLPPPISTIQAVLACIKDMDFHKFLQTMDMETFNIVGENNEIHLLILETLAIRDWTHLLEISNIDCQKGIIKLKKNATLYEMLENDVKELEEVTKIARPLDVALAQTNATNNEELASNLNIPLTNHPLMSILQVSEIEKVACEDFKEGITLTQMEVGKAALRNFGRIPTTPLLLYGVVELDVFNVQHKMWMLPNINLLAPISKHMWQMWGNLSKEEILAYKKLVE